jgi:hypothetical protein
MQTLARQATSKLITENMGGQIGFDTEIGKGSTFWIEFPSAVAIQTPKRGAWMPGSGPGMTARVMHNET